jgi:cytochrome oxidase Cu insertion factor (SCO1/SenC/PrrC family)
MRRILVLSSVFVALWGCSAPSSLDDVGPVPDFQLTERSGRTVTLADLRGKIWVASFVFTRCTGPCPQVTGTMARLQNEKVVTNHDDVFLVSFTVDPDRDNLADLREYADHFGADKERWLFLTGPKEVIDPLCEKGFGLGLEREAGKEITHSTRLVLVDRKGHKRGYFDGQTVDYAGRPIDDLPRLKEAIAALLREQP